MITPSVLTEQLTALTLTLDSPGTEIAAVLDVLTDDLMAAVPSFLGLTMTLQQDAGPITLTAINRALALTAEASLEISLDAIVGTRSGGTLVCYARRSGSFGTLAAEIGRSCRVHPPTAADPVELVGISGLGDLTVVNRAIGVLISRGDSPAEAHSALLQRASRAALSVPDVARQVLRSTNAPPRGPGIAPRPTLEGTSGRS